MAIYELDGTFTISSHQQWRPGVYDSQRTARYAQRFTDDELQRLQDSINPGGIITYEMLKAFSKNKPDDLLKTWRAEDPSAFISDQEILQAIRHYEQQFGMTSEQLLKALQQGTAPDSVEIMDWKILLEWVQQNKTAARLEGNRAAE